MCDYSAHGVKSRAAVKEETLVSHKISSHTAGFVGIRDKETAVCLLPGTELSFEKDVKVASIAFGFGHKVFRDASANQKVATFVQVNKENPQVHHDALQFVDGTIVMLNDLSHGQKVTVVQLPADPSTLQGKAREAAVAEQQRAAYT